MLGVWAVFLVYAVKPSVAASLKQPMDLMPEGNAFPVAVGTADEVDVGLVVVTEDPNR